mmetsp:Transcript_15180/g.23903  ORF Transcript_15180/g.23903 Transcript_15180/m.23903 type:complete len:129 (-) Transcript_15180:88-474(-)
MAACQAAFPSSSACQSAAPSSPWLSPSCLCTQRSQRSTQGRLLALGRALGRWCDQDCWAPAPPLPLFVKNSVERRLVLQATWKFKCCLCPCLRFLQDLLRSSVSKIWIEFLLLFDDPLRCSRKNGSSL